MRYSSALVLSTLAVGQAAAGNARHASFHARRNGGNVPKAEDVDYKGLAEALKVRFDYGDLDWSSILKTVDFKTINYGPTSTADVQVKATPAAVATSSSTPEPKPTPSPSSTQEAAKPSETAKSNPIGDALEGLFDNLDSFLSKMGVKAPVNSQTAGGKIWLGSAGTAPLRVKHINKSGKELKLLCWLHTADFKGMTINVTPPQIAVNLPVNGQAVVTSHADSAPFACSPATSSTQLNYGIVKNTWFEGQSAGIYGTFDVSKNPNMQGTAISAKGSICTSDMATCFFECTKSTDSCTTDYKIRNCGSEVGGHSGFDAVMKGDGGGCKMSTQEEITVNYG